MKKIFLFLFLVSCGNPILTNENSKILDFNSNLSFDEFKMFLNKYAKSIDYPNLDE